MVELTRIKLADEICRRLDDRSAEAREQWEQSPPVKHFVIDDLLPQEWAARIASKFPANESMTLRRSLREKKYVASQMDRYHPLLEESIYAFQSPEVIGRIEAITTLAGLEADRMLYAGGISVMAPGHFLNPHIDNSHDKFRTRFRALNLLYYVTPGWSSGHGGNLELWQDGPAGAPLTIDSSFNRLVVMLTHQNSWHSVSPNRSSLDRRCVSNYDFSALAPQSNGQYHVTSYRGRPEQPVRDLTLRLDNWVRTLIRTRLPGAFKNHHYYKQRADTLKPPPASRPENSSEKT